MPDVAKTPPSDAAPTPDAPAPVPTVTVSITDIRGARAGVRVVFHDEDGAVIETKLTGNDGKAVHTGKTPSMASALIENADGKHIVTWTGIEDGDDLQLRDDGRSYEDIGTYAITLGSAFDGADIYRVETPCGDSSPYGTGANMPIYRYCAAASNSALATARSWRTGVLAYSFKKGVGGGEADGGTVSATTGDWTEPSAFETMIANAPVDEIVYDELLEISEGAGFSNRSRSGDESKITYKTAAGFAEAYQASIDYGDEIGRRGITKRVAAGTTKIAVDYTKFLPEVKSMTLEHANPIRPTLEWESVAGVDGGVVRFGFSRGDDWLDWAIVVAPGAKKVVAPSMPPEAESFLPRASDGGDGSEFTTPEAIFVEADTLPGYREFRRSQGALLGILRERAPSLRRRLPPLPSDATFRTTVYSPESPR